MRPRKHDSIELHYDIIIIFDANDGSIRSLPEQRHISFVVLLSLSIFDDGNQCLRRVNRATHSMGHAKRSSPILWVMSTYSMGGSPRSPPIVWVTFTYTIGD